MPPLGHFVRLIPGIAIRGALLRELQTDLSVPAGFILPVMIPAAFRLRIGWINCGMVFFAPGQLRGGLKTGEIKR